MLVVYGPIGAEPLPTSDRVVTRQGEGWLVSQDSSRTGVAMKHVEPNRRILGHDVPAFFADRG
jgi:hypothetical protein